MPSDSQTAEFRGGAGGQHDRLQRLGKYQIQRKLGAGGMGTVFLAVDRELNRTVALKVLPKERAENPTLVRRFKSEAQAAAQLEHKNIVRVYEAGEVDGFLYIALEYIDGIDVHELVAKRGVLPVKRSIDIVKQVARALDHAASKQIVHRDIKPANLMIKRDGTVKLADMGLARSIDESIETSITRAGMTVGTVDYMSPEQARSSQSADVRSDIYSLGCTWYHMLTGVPPYPEGGLTEKLQAHALAKRPDPRIDNDAVPEAVVAVIHRMMARKPQERYQTPQELLADLELASKTLTTLDATVLEALAEESESSSHSKARTRSRPAAGAASGPAALPPKDTFKPVDLTTGRSIDIDVLRVAAPAVLVVALLGAIVWFIQQSDDDGSAGTGPAESFPSVVDQRNVNGADGARPRAEDAPSNGDKPGQSDDHQLASLARGPGLEGAPSVVGIPFPGAEDAATTAGGVPLIPNWVDSFRQPSVSQSHKLRVTRRASGSDQFRRLNAALKALPPDGGTIELDGEGPFVLEPTSVATRGTVRLSAAAGRRPVVYLSAAGRPVSSDGFLKVRAPQLEMENLHLVMVDPVGSVTLLRVEEGDVVLRNCSITVDGGSTDDVTAVLVEGQSNSSDRRRPNPSSSGRCLLENVICRGDRLTAVHLHGGNSELVAGNCLIHSGDAPAVIVTETGVKSPSGRNLRLMATTLISGRSAVRFVREGDRPPGPYEIVSRRSLFAAGHSADPGSRALMTLEGWPSDSSSIGSSRAAGVNWSTEESLYAGWPSLVRMSDEDGHDVSEVVTADEWRQFWNKALTSDAVAGMTELPPGWDQPASIVPEDVAPERWAAFSNAQGRASAGCRPAEFHGTPFGMMEHVTIASRAPDIPDGFGPDMKVDESPITFDLTKRSSLGNLLENNTTCPDGAHVIATGSGLHKLGPIEIADKSIRLEFRQVGSTPLIIQIMSDGGEGVLPPAAITVRNGALDLVGAHFKMPATSSKTQPPWLVRLEAAGIAIRGCTLEGPSTASPGHAGLIQVASDEPVDANPRECVLVEDSFLISPGSLLSGPVRWESMILRNSVFVARGDAVTCQLDEAGLRQRSTAVVDHCTIAAGRSAFRFEGDVPPADAPAPLQFIVTASLFAGAATREDPSATVVSRISASQTEHLVRWWGNANGFAPMLPRYVMTGESASSPGSFSNVWTAAWGVGHEAHPLFSPTDVVFAAPLPEWTALQPSRFALNATSPAATWASDMSAIGAHLEEVGSEDVQPAADEGNSSAGSPARNSPKPSPKRSQNRNPF
ncbi:MAG: serine/threonine-protein kinase [Planctomycetaceae bacterium]